MRKSSLFHPFSHLCWLVLSRLQGQRVRATARIAAQGPELGSDRYGVGGRGLNKNEKNGLNIEDCSEPKALMCD